MHQTEKERYQMLANYVVICTHMHLKLHHLSHSLNLLLGENEVSFPAIGLFIGK
jgi:hypothetical protein